MKKILAFLGLTVLTALLCSSVVKLGYAGSISVGTYDTKGLSRDTFSPGEHVRIIAESSHTSITIIITDPDSVVVQNVTYERAILGSSDGTAYQYFSFDRSDVSDVSTWILEGEIWVGWQPVDDFLESDENSRVYKINIDEEGGSRIQFGDGENGRIPAAGEDNIKATYRTGVGEEGNVVEGEVKNLLTSIVYNKTLSGLTSKLGWYTVEASSLTDEVRKNYASIHFNAVPEIPLGTISAVTIMLLGLGFYGLVQRKKPR